MIIIIIIKPFIPVNMGLTFVFRFGKLFLIGRLIPITHGTRTHNHQAAKMNPYHLCYRFFSIRCKLYEWENDYMRNVLVLGMRNIHAYFHRAYLSIGAWNEFLFTIVNCLIAWLLEVLLWMQYIETSERIPIFLHVMEPFDGSECTVC